jgi:hypothetical protein
MRKSWPVFVFALLTVLASSRPAAAQVEVSGGYNFLRLLDEQVEGDDKNFAKGWYADLAVGRTIAVVGQISGNYKTFGDLFDFKLHSYMGGVRFGGGRSRGAVPFVQVLGGAFRTGVSGLDTDESETDRALQIGAGVNVLPAGGIGLRLGADYVRVFTEGEGANVLRFGVGIVFRP